MVAFVLLALVLGGCDSDGVRVTIENRGTVPLNAVVLHVRGGTYPLGDFPPGVSKSIAVAVTEESNVELSHAGGDQRLVIDTYIEPGSEGSVYAAVTRDSVLSVEQDINIAPLL